jgi:hypothetical protein
MDAPDGASARGESMTPTGEARPPCDERVRGARLLFAVLLVVAFTGLVELAGVSQNELDVWLRWAAVCFSLAVPVLVTLWYIYPHFWQRYQAWKTFPAPKERSPEQRRIARRLTVEAIVGTLLQLIGVGATYTGLVAIAGHAGQWVAVGAVVGATVLTLLLTRCLWRSVLSEIF